MVNWYPDFNIQMRGRCWSGSKGGPGNSKPHWSKCGSKESLRSQKGTKRNGADAESQGHVNNNSSI